MKGQQRLFHLRKLMDLGLMDWSCVDYLWIIVMFFQLFELSFWRHPFTAENPLVSKWCNAIFFFKTTMHNQTDIFGNCIATWAVLLLLLYYLKTCSFAHSINIKLAEASHHGNSLWICALSVCLTPLSVFWHCLSLKIAFMLFRCLFFRIAVHLSVVHHLFVSLSHHSLHCVFFTVCPVLQFGLEVPFTEKTRESCYKVEWCVLPYLWTILSLMCRWFHWQVLFIYFTRISSTTRRDLVYLHAL